MQTYTVQVGDTLYGISKQFGVPIEQIKKDNNLSSNTITPGQVLKIATSTTTSFYIVKPGDTLFSIASRYDTTVADLIQLNNLKTNVLSVGQQLKIPINDDTSSNFTVYTVKAGDNLYTIAKKYNVSVSTIQMLNDLNSTVLMIGQKLKIPTSSNDSSGMDYQVYIVKVGDSLYKIAQNHDMTVDELVQLNNLKTTVLTVGQSLKVKKQASSTIPPGAECYGEGYSKPIYVTYTVKRGDSLYTIAKQFNTTAQNLITLNALVNDKLSIGQILKIREITE